ncbi:GGDEF domain-containing protein [Ideonella livida]|uniref:diguanylate cyclase n=1 Tax=Ideonella livida TaxID=2707176 RepID=A0A7C9TIT1_9BURK|nr:GGDEF domain-containing protein [Ideonella livida]NDY91521.1 GGDEF domain-containing protein [Ideonella livida]
MNLSAVRRHFPPEPPALQVEAALQLLRQAGHAAPPGAPGSQAWLQGLVDALCELSSRDVLTGLANRRGLESALLRELDRVARTGEPALLLLLDVDDHPRVQQLHGRAVAEQALQTVGRDIAAQLRPMDLAARLEGQCFAVLLPNCAPGFGQEVADGLCARVAALDLPGLAGRRLGLTASVGGAFAGPARHADPAAWLGRAGLQLDRARLDGGHRACLETTAHSTVSADEKDLLFTPVGAMADEPGPRAARP